MTQMNAPGDIRFRLLNEFQRDFPVVQRPYRLLAERLSLTEPDVIGLLDRLKSEGAVARVGGTIRPNTAGASTLAAMSVPPAMLADVATLLSALPSVNHSYLRENEWNLWFVVTAPDEPALVSTLAQINKQAGLRVLDLRLVKSFHIDLGFNLSAREQQPSQRDLPDAALLEESDRPLLQALCDGLAIVPEPYAALGQALGWPVDRVMARISTLVAAGIVTRLGVIVRHRALGWTSNAMVVWDIAPGAIASAGEALAALPGVSLCYQRRTVQDVWPYPLYIMVHAQTRADALAVVSMAASLPELRGTAHKVLFSTHCFKQTSAWVHRKEAA